MMKALLAMGADPEALSPEGTGGVLLATWSRELAAVQLAVALGLDVNIHPPGRPSALHAAIRVGADDIVQHLAASGANFETVDHHGRTPLEEANYEAPTHTIELMQRLTEERRLQGTR
mgnify:FL=1